MAVKSKQHAQAARPPTGPSAAANGAAIFRYLAYKRAHTQIGSFFLEKKIDKVNH